MFDLDRYRVTPGAAFDLSTRAPDDLSAFDGDKDAGKRLVEEQSLRLEELQELLYAEGKHKVLLVLQAMDTAGKDSTIRHVFRSVDPIGVRVTSFKKPTEEELAHDYLWRVHRHTPGTGEISIFNRSHYEDVLVVRVHNLVPEERWRRRYDHIRAFEQLLVDEGTTLVKCFLHISPEAQAERLQARLDDETKRWKFRKGDLAERGRWTEYMAAYEEALAATSTPDAPWYVIPSDRKWYRNLVVGQLLIRALESLDMEYPNPEEDLEGVVIR